jgi:Holliday junction DNA helicase RuvA
MIGKLTGTLELMDNGKALLDVNGVGYVVQCSSRTLNKIGSNGAQISLLVETQVREDAITLIGFADAAEKEAFLTLTTVQGVGARVALSILSTLAPDQLAHAILSGDKAMLATADGVGPKLAARLLTELKDKAVAFSGGSVVSFPTTGATAAAPSVTNDVVSTLANLGFRRDQAFSAVMGVLAANKNAPFDELIRLSLQDLSMKR